MPQEKFDQCFVLPENASDRRGCNKIGISEHWKHRVKGFLFFSRSFEYISNNKLKLQVYPSLQVHLSDERIWSKFTTRPGYLSQTRGRFKEWLKACYDFLDNDFIFHDPLSDEDIPHDFPEGSRSTKDLCREAFSMRRFMIYRSVRLQAREEKCEVGDVVKLRVTNSGKASDAPSAKKVLGVIQGFVVSDVGFLGQEYSGTDVQILYSRAPQDIYPSDLRCVDLLALNLTLGRSHVIVSKEALKDVREASARSVHLYMAEKNGVKPNVWDPTKTLYLNQSYYVFALQLRNAKGKAVTEAPDGSQYSIKLTWCDEGGDIRPIRDASKDWWLFDSRGRKWVKCANADRKKGFLPFWGLTPPTSGHLELHADIRVDNKHLFTQKFETWVETPPIVSWTVEYKDQEYLFGTMPDLTLRFYRDEANSAPGCLTCKGDDRGLKLVFTCENLTFACQSGGSRGEINHDIIYDVDDSLLSIKQDHNASNNKDRWQFKVIPDGERPFLSTEDPRQNGITEVKLELIDYRSTEGSKSRAIGAPQVLKIPFYPGPPHRVMILGEDSITIQAGAALPPIEIAVFDKWGHRTTSREGDWTIESKCSSVFECLREVEVGVRGSSSLSVVHVDAAAVTEEVYDISFCATYPTRQRTKRTAPCVLKVRVVPDRIPHHVALQHRGQVWRESHEQTVRAGQTIDGLTMCLLDGNDDVLDITETLVGSRGCTFNIGWPNITPTTQHIELDNGRIKLPPIRIPEKITVDGIISYEYSIVIRGNHQVPASSLRIKVIPEEPRAWKFVRLASFNNTLVPCDARDIAHRILGACVVDKFDNIVPTEEDWASTITYFANDPEGDGDAENANCGKPLDVELIDGVNMRGNIHYYGDMTRDQALQGMRSHDNDSFNALGDDNIFRLDDFTKSVWLKVAGIGTAARFTEETLELSVVAGPPSAVLISSQRYALEKVTDGTISVTTDNNMSDFVVYLEDAAGNPAQTISDNKSVFTVRDSFDNVYLESTNVVGLRSNEHGLKRFKVEGVKRALQTSLSSSQAVAAISGADQSFEVTFNLEYSHHGKIVQCSPARLKCSFMRTNVVEAIRIGSAKDNQSSTIEQERVLDMDENESHEIFLGDPLPTLDVTALTQDGVPFIPDPSSYTIAVRAGKSLIKKVYLVGVVNAEKGGVRFRPKQPYDENFDLASGSYTISVVYKEARENFLYRKKNVTTSMSLLVKRGEMASLAIRPDLIEMNQSSGLKQVSGIIESSVTVEPRDRRGFCADTTSFDELRMRCTVRREGAQSSHTQSDPCALQLKGADGDGYVWGQWRPRPISSAHWAFGTLELDTSSVEDSSSGAYILEFSFPDRPEPRLTIPFNFTSSEERATLSHFLRGELHEVIEELRHIRQTLEAANADADQNILDIRTIMQKPSMSEIRHDLKVHNPKNINSMSVSAVTAIRSNLKKDIIALSGRVTAARPEVIDVPHILHSALLPIQNFGDDALGFVVQLATVEDERDARIISWCMQRFMHCLVFKERGANSEKAFNKDFAVWSLNDIVPFQGKLDTGGTLKLGVLPVIRNIPEEKKPRYMVNALTLSPSHEYLRKSIFWEALRDAILVDTNAHLNTIRDHLVKRNARVPNMYSREGVCVRSSGVRDPRGGKLPSSLRYVFGGNTNPEDSRDLREKCELVADLGEVGDLLEKRVELQAAVRAAAQEEDAKGKALRKKEAEIRKKISDAGFGSQSQLSDTSQTLSPSALPAAPARGKRDLLIDSKSTCKKRKT